MQALKKVNKYGICIHTIQFSSVQINLFQVIFTINIYLLNYMGQGLKKHKIKTKWMDGCSSDKHCQREFSFT